MVSGGELTHQERVYSVQGRYLAENMYNNIHTQGHIFSKVNGKSSFKGIKYWEQYMKYESSENGRNRGRTEIATILHKNGKYDEAFKIL